MKKELILKEIYRQNQQWNDSAEFFSELDSLKHKRRLFFELVPYLEKRQIISIVGLRRTGKTVLLKQLIRQLTKNNAAKNIVFLTFDEAIFPKGITLADYLDAYLEHIAPERGKLYFFLDEIQYAQKWQHIIKRYYDTNARIKFVVSGSSSLFLKKKTTESLVGRIFEFQLPVLSFEEYLELRNEKTLLAGYQKNALGMTEEITNLKERQDFYRQFGNNLERTFENYLLFGQFPEIVGEEDGAVVKKYLNDSVYKKTIEYDIPKIFSVEKIDELKFLFQVLISEIGSVVEIGNISREVGVDKKTIKKYLHYFEESFLIHLLYNFSKSIRKSRRLQKKVYLGSTNFYSAFHDFKDNGSSGFQIGFLAENYCLHLLKKEFEYLFFYRVRQDEIDFLGTSDLIDKKQWHFFEIKYRNGINSKELKFINKISAKNQTGYRIISKNELAVKNGYSIMPIWMLK